MDDKQTWIINKLFNLEKEDYGTNLTAVRENISNQKFDLKNFEEFQKSKHSLAAQSISDQFVSLTNKRAHNLQTLQEVDKLENIFGNVNNEFVLKALTLTKSISQNHDPTERTSPNSYQSSILALRNNWVWIEALLKCSQTHLKHAADYHQFYNTCNEYVDWMPVELDRSANLLDMSTVKANMHGDVAVRLVFEIKSALAMYCDWRWKCVNMLIQSRSINPIYFRTEKLDHERKAILLINYETKQIKLQEGEEVILVDNSKIDYWTIKSLRGEKSDIPSTILTIPGPDPQAVEHATRLFKAYLANWTKMIKKYGATIIHFLLQVIRDWSPEETKLLKSLSETDKKSIRDMLTMIESIFSEHWGEYAPYKTLKSRMDNLRKILNEKCDTISSNNESGLLVVQTGVIEDLLNRYKDFWSNWETFKVLVEVTGHPEYLLVVDDWNQYKSIEVSEWLKRWQTQLDLQDLHDVDLVDSINAQLTNGFLSDECRIQKANESAVTSQLTTSEQEEQQTFVITGVIDPLNGDMISLDQAVSLGIINQVDGKYVDKKNGEKIPIPVAMNAGKIKVEMMTVKKSAELKKDIGIITIKVIRESRPYALLGIIDAKTDKRMSVEEAVKAGVLDQKNSIYKNTNTNEDLSLADALDSGLLIVDFQIDAVPGEPVVETQTYAVHAVVDQRSKEKVAFSQALKLGIVVADEGAYVNNVTGESIYIGEAIKKGFMKASIVHDPKLIEIVPGQRIMVAEEKLNNFRAKMMQPIRAMSALRKAGGSNV